MTQARTLATSPDGQWVAVRTGRDVVLLAAGAAPPVGRLTLEADDVDLELVGPPSVLVTVSRTAGATQVVLHQPPYLEATARLDLDGSFKLIAVTGPRLALLPPDGKQVTVVRAAGRALSSQVLDVASPVEFAVGLERNQILFGLLRKLEVWDAVSGRALLRPQLQLPPPPRSIGTAQGHLWAIRPGSDEVLVYRLSDGRPFRHYVGAPVDDVISHPGSPLIVLVTARGLVRLNCFAHSLTMIDDAPWSAPPAGTPGIPLAQLVHGDDISLIGLPDGDSLEPWRVALGGAGAPAVAVAEAPADAGLVTAADKLRAMRGASGPEPVTEPVRTETRPARAWREPLATYGHELARGVDGELPVVAIDTELGELAHRLGLSSAARRALTALYALHLVGEPALAIARLARATADWAEALGQGELGALALLRRKHGKVALRAAVTDLLDGVPPRSIRIVGGPPTTPHAGAFRVSREARADAAIETELATRLGRIGVVEGPLASALLEARLHGATAVMMTPPGERPRPWPRDAGLVLVLYGTASAWVADVPSL